MRGTRQTVGLLASMTWIEACHLEELIDSSFKLRPGAAGKLTRQDMAVMYELYEQRANEYCAYHGALADVALWDGWTSIWRLEQVLYTRHGWYLTLINEKGARGDFKYTPQRFITGVDGVNPDDDARCGLGLLPPYAEYWPEECEASQSAYSALQEDASE